VRTVTPTSGDAERFARRAARVRRRPWLVAAGVGLSGVLVLALAWAVAFSSLLDVRVVAVIGVSGAEADAVRDAAKVPMDRPLIRVDTSAIAQRITTARRPVKAVTVTRQYPHTIALAVTLREPAIVLKKSQAQLDLVDDTGFDYGSTTEPPEGIPVVTTDTGAATEQLLSAALAALDAFPQSRRSAVSQIHVSGRSVVTFKLDESLIVWGTEGDAQKKARIVEILLRQTPKPGTIDVTAPDAPVTR